MKKIGLSLIAILLFLTFVSASFETDFMNLLNKERASLGKQPLSIDSNLTKAAELHSKDMALKKYFSHTSLDGKTFDQRILNAGYINYLALGENIAYHSGTPDAQKVFTMWKNSPGHYSNMISDNFNEAGLGIYTYNGLTYYTNDFGKQRIFSSPTYPVPQLPKPAPSPSPPISPIPTTPKSEPITNYYINLGVTKTITSYYNYYRISGRLNEKSPVNYKTDLGSEGKVCSNCSSFYFYIKTPRSSIPKITFTSNHATRTITLR